MDCLLLPFNQVSINNSDIYYTWTIAPAAGPAAAARNGDQDSNDSCHYGILLARMAGLPNEITSRALQVADVLEQRQQQRQLQQQQGMEGTKNLRQVSKLII